MKQRRHRMPHNASTSTTPSLAVAAAMDPATLLHALGSSEHGLSTSEAARGTALHGANLVHTYSVHWWPVLRRQFASPLLLLLAATCLTAGFLGQSGNAFGDSSMQGVGSEPGVRALMQASAVSR